MDGGMGGDEVTGQIRSDEEAGEDRREQGHSQKARRSLKGSGGQEESGGDKGRTSKATRIQVSSYTCSVAMSPSRRMISPTSSACPTRTSSYMAAPAMRMAVTTAGTLHRHPLVCPKCPHCPRHAAIPGPETPCTAPSRLSFSMSAIRVPTSPSMVVALMARLVARTLYGDSHRRGLGGTGCTQCDCGCGLCTVNSTSPPVPTPHRHTPALTQLIGTADNPDHHHCYPTSPPTAHHAIPHIPRGAVQPPYQLQSWDHTSPPQSRAPTSPSPSPCPRAITNIPYPLLSSCPPTSVSPIPPPASP